VASLGACAFGAEDPYDDLSDGDELSAEVEVSTA